jgi:hypothetical protein
MKTPKFIFKQNTDLFVFRLKTFLGEKIALQNADLQTLLFPVFVHIYIEMLSNGHKAPGKLYNLSNLCIETIHIKHVNKGHFALHFLSINIKLC